MAVVERYPGAEGRVWDVEKLVVLNNEQHK